jgi:hypothetical protein
MTPGAGEAGGDRLLSNKRIVGASKRCGKL